MSVNRPLIRLLCVAGLLLAGVCRAATYPLPPEDVDVIGAVQTVQAEAEDTLLEIGQRHGVGYEEMRAANPSVDPWLPGAGTKVVVPTRYVLPAGPREGLVLNLAELRLYYFPPARPGEPRTVETYPVGIGRMDWQTPLGETRVVAKVKDPAWFPPASIRKEAAARGETMPLRVPPGPQNPLGRYAMKLGLPGYLIHSTNRPRGVGMRVSHGCVRMFPEDIENLIYRVAVDTPVRIVDQRYKVGWFAGVLYLEVHPLPEGVSEPAEEMAAAAFRSVAASLEGRPHRVDPDRVRRVVEQHQGVPTAVSRGGEPVAALR